VAQETGSAGNLPWLYAGRGIRSFATAFLTVVFPLYLARQHVSSTTVGAVLTAGSFLGALLVAAVGIVGDRIGRRPVLIGVGVLGVLGALALAGTTNLAVAALASGLGGIGRGGGAGSGGAFGPFFPAEQPLLAASVPPTQRTRAFAHLGLLGVLAAAAGSLVAGLPAALHDLGLSIDAGYRLVFVLGALCSAAVVLVSFPLREHRPARASAPGVGQAALEAEAAASTAPAVTAAPSGSVAPPAAAGSAGSGLSTRQLIGRLGLTNALNGFGFGFLGPLLTYWFHVRFGVGAAEVGLVFTVVNLVSALPYLGADRLTARLGAVRTVAVTRGLSVLLLIGMAPAPTFTVAALLLALRTVANSLGIPARQSYTMGVADERRRGTVAALGTLPSMVTSSISPVVGGALMGAFVDVPIVGAALFMGANTLSYYLAFRHAPPPEEQGRGAARPSRGGRG